ncbi:uncharacterized protein LOC131298641 [Rhododendron vialii]|uniref:uncharacterized protein LOC131298641 n=1 Tax=Rhododendron vialii TaxID=182163 RepID=UPI00265E40C6|nr:uncharacterized protein LOC131298641 [Rhododendron vialii]
MREFSRRNPPQFDGESSDPLVADHWLAQIRKIFNALKITEDDLRWWESILGVRRDARRAAKVANEEIKPVEESLTWAEFETLFENQYFLESYREQLRNQFERFQTLSRFAPESVATEDRKCRHFEKGLHPSVKKFVVGQKIGGFSDIVKCARSIKYTKETPEEVKVWEPRQRTVRMNKSTKGSKNQRRKRHREQCRSTSSQHSSEPPNFSRMLGVLSGSTIVCYRCCQSSHRAINCPQEREYHGQRPLCACYRCCHSGYLAVDCPQLTSRGSVQRAMGSGHAQNIELQGNVNSYDDVMITYA